MHSTTENISYTIIYRKNTISNIEVTTPGGIFTLEKSLGHGAYASGYLLKNRDNQSIVVLIPNNSNEIYNNDAEIADMSAEDQQCVEQWRIDINNEFTTKMRYTNQCYGEGAAILVQNQNQPPILFTPYFDGYVLKDIITPMPSFIGLLLGIIRAITGMHKNNVVHHDLYLANLIMSEKARVLPFIFDFGLSGEIGKPGRAKFVKEDPGYYHPQTAPELYTETSGVEADASNKITSQVIIANPASDVYSLAYLIEETMRRASCFYEYTNIKESAEVFAEAFNAKYRQLLNAEIMPPPGQELVNLIFRCSNEDPAERPDLSEIREFLESLAEQQIKHARQALSNLIQEILNQEHNDPLLKKRPKIKSYLHTFARRLNDTVEFYQSTADTAANLGNRSGLALELGNVAEFIEDYFDRLLANASTRVERRAIEKLRKPLIPYLQVLQSCAQGFSRNECIAQMPSDLFFTKPQSFDAHTATDFVNHFIKCILPEIYTPGLNLEDEHFNQLIANLKQIDVDIDASAVLTRIQAAFNQYDDDFNSSLHPNLKLSDEAKNAIYSSTDAARELLPLTVAFKGVVDNASRLARRSNAASRTTREMVTQNNQPRTATKTKSSHTTHKKLSAANLPQSQGNEREIYLCQAGFFPPAKLHELADGQTEENHETLSIKSL